MWKDGYVRSLNPTEKLLFIYFLTNEYVNQVWLYECPIDLICFDTGISKKEVEIIKGKLQTDLKIAFYKDYVYLINAQKYETYSGELNQKAKDKILSYIPTDVLDWYTKILDRGIDTPINTLPIPIINNNIEIINNKGGVGGNEIAQKLIDFFNKKTGHTYKLTSGRIKKINERLKTFTPREIAQAIEKMLNEPFYKGENARRWEADPDFILRNDEQIDKFLGKTKQLQVERLSDLIQ